jgi:hypothetical protein
MGVESVFRISSFLLTILVLLTTPNIAGAADDVGRYEMIAIPKTASTSYQSVMILDTKEGHLWEWVSLPAVGAQTPGDSFLRYQGKVKPGKAMGEVIEKKP